MKHIQLFTLLLLCSLFHLYGQERIVFAAGKAHIFFDVRLDEFPDPDNPLFPPTEEDFKQAFARLTGTALPLSASPDLIPLRARFSSDPGFNPQYCQISVRSGGITLTARSAVGVVNGLYTLLDKWGCRWVLPGELGEVIPRVDQLLLPESEETIVIAMDSRVDSSWMQGEEHPDWRRRNRRGNNIWLTAQHYWFYAIPPDKYFKEHPEYYALIGGKRVPTQLCTSNPKVRELMVQKAFEYFQTHPSIDSFPMDPEDNHDHCQCENCLTLDITREFHKGDLSVTNRVAAFANYVAERIADKFPDKKVGFYAYANKKLPPAIKLHKSIFVPYTRDSSSLIHLLSDPAVPSSEEYWDLLARWQKVCADMYIYEYDPVSWTGSLPCPIYLERGRALKKQYAMGIKGAINDQGPRGDATLFVNRFMEARFRSNPNLDPEAELNDMCNRFFGPAGQPMNQYYLTLAKITDCKTDIRFGIAGYDRMFTPEMIRDARGFLNQALNIGLQHGDSTLGKRLYMVDLAQKYLEAYLNFIWDLRGKNYEKSVRDADDIFAAIDALVAENPNYLEGVDARHRLTTAVKKNLARFFPSEMQFLRDWQVVGPYNNEKRDGIIVAPQLAYEDGALHLAGEAVQVRHYRSPEGFIDFHDAFKEKVDLNHPSYAYAFTTVQCATPRMVKLYTDSFHPFKIWLNNQLVYAREGADADCPDKRQVGVRLQAGANHIAVMVAQGGISSFVRWGFWLRLADGNGRIFSLADLQKKPEVDQKDQIEVLEAFAVVNAQKLTNLVPNPALSGVSTVEATTFGVWPPPMRERVSIDTSFAGAGKGAVKFTGVVGASFNRFFKVKAGEKYLAGFSAHNHGSGVCYLHVGWRGKGVFLDNVSVSDFFPQGGENWQRIAGIVTVPPEADELTFSVSVSGQGVNESCYATDLFLYKLP